jgi:hypothetical protein
MKFFLLVLNIGMEEIKFVEHKVHEYVYLFCLCFSAVALSLNFTHHDIFFFVQYCLFTINYVFLLVTYISSTHAHKHMSYVYP